MFDVVSILPFAPFSFDSCFLVLVFECSFDLSFSICRPSTNSNPPPVPVLRGSLSPFPSVSSTGPNPRSPIPGPQSPVPSPPNPRHSPISLCSFAADLLYAGWHCVSKARRISFVSLQSFCFWFGLCVSVLLFFYQFLLLRPIQCPAPLSYPTTLLFLLCFCAL